MIMGVLRERAIENSPLCVGIDLREDHIPKELKNLTIAEQYITYTKEIIEASKNVASCYKVQIACYESLGLEGLGIYKNILEEIRKTGHIVIADVKRGDIGSTAEMYAKAHFSGDFEADILTLSAYMGFDSVEPYQRFIKEKNKGAFILGKTSNSGSKDFQDLKIGDKTLYEKVINSIKIWNDAIKDDEFGAFGVVVGVNNANELDRIKKATEDLFLLIPGYGAQGAKIEDIRDIICKRKNGVVNISRGYTANIEGDFRKELRSRAERFAKELRECFK